MLLCRTRVRCTAGRRISPVCSKAPLPPSLAGPGKGLASRGAALQGSAHGTRHLHPVTGHLRDQYVEGSSFSLLLCRRGRGRTDSSLADEAAWGRLGKGSVKAMHLARDRAEMNGYPSIVAFGKGFASLILWVLGHTVGFLTLKPISLWKKSPGKTGKPWEVAVSSSDPSPGSQFYTL